MKRSGEFSEQPDSKIEILDPHPLVDELPLKLKEGGFQFWWLCVVYATGYR